MPRRVVDLRFGEIPFLNICSYGRGSHGSTRLSPSQVAQIRRTVGRTPEVMVKVTGGGSSPGAVAAHLSYLSHRGEVELETDEGERVSKDAQKEMLEDWHLELSHGQYRRGSDPGKAVRPVKLVHNIVLSMPAPTPADKVLVAAKAFAREKFGTQHRYLMALHTHQQHPHVHLVVKSEGHDGQRLHIDKARLREWREDFAQLMRDQGIAANATSRFVRGQGKKASSQASYRAKQRASSYALRAELTSVASELSKTGTIRDSARPRLVETRKALVARWDAVATALDAQGEVVLAGDARYFARHLPPVLTDRERLAAELIRHLDPGRDRPERQIERAR